MNASSLAMAAGECTPIRFFRVNDPAKPPLAITAAAAPSATNTNANGTVNHSGASDTSAW
jgi:hypothetical protein